MIKWLKHKWEQLKAVLDYSAEGQFGLFGEEQEEDLD
jgi:hypothetical protein